MFSSFLNWGSHALISALLFSQCGQDAEKRKLAGLIAVSLDWCWDQFLSLDDPLKPWALKILKEYVTEGDDAPEILKQDLTPEAK